MLNPPASRDWDDDDNDDLFDDDPGLDEGDHEELFSDDDEWDACRWRLKALLGEVSILEAGKGGGPKGGGKGGRGTRGAKGG